MTDYEKKYSVIILGFSLCLTALMLFSSCGTGHIRTPSYVAEAIRQNYDSSLSTYESKVQRHYAVRLYRLTGDETYLQPILIDAGKTVMALQADIQNLTDSEYIAARSDYLRERINPKTRKGRLRLAMFEQHGSIDFYLNLLYNTNQMREYCLNQSEAYKSIFGQAMVVLRETAFEDFLLDTAVIRVYSAQAVNYVYYLNELGINDIRQEYNIAFRSVFPDSLDNQLSHGQYLDKIYGLTHFILAASDYYQRPVDSTNFKWILNYFESNLDRLLSDATSDIIAEVGICFLLSGYQRHPVVERCRHSIISSFNEEHQMLLSPKGNSDQKKGEHRNVLAIMLLNWPKQLFEGPCLLLPNLVE